MKVIVAAGGRFHAINLAHQLHIKNSLLQLITFAYTPKDAEKIPSSLVSSITSCKLMNDAFVSLRLSRLINRASFNIFKDNLFDSLTRKKIATQEHFDIFIGWAHYSLSSLPVAKKAGAITIIESGSCHIAEQQELLKQEYNKWKVPHPPIHTKTIEKMTAEYEQADYIMTLSSFAQQSFIKQGIPPSKVLKSPCGVDVEYFLHSPTKPHDRFRVICVGLVTLRKGIQYLLSAWEKAKLPQQKTELIIVGQIQKDFAAIMRTLPIAPNVSFIGPTDRQSLRNLYQSSSLFVLPSIEDGFGMVIGEAMASGLPVICSTNTGAPELIQHEVHGYLVQPGNSIDLAEKIQWCYEHHHECIQMGMQGQQRIQEFTWNAYGNNVHAIYEKLIHEKK
jgi:glycosyltransferase involved in cell wall biosynthesis